MKTKYGLIRFLITGLMFTAPSLAFPQQEAVNGSYDSTNDWFVFQWVNPKTGKQQSIIDSPYKVKPVMHGSVSFDSSAGAYTYSYQVTNQAGALQVLQYIFVKHSSAVFGGTTPSSEWTDGEYRSGGTWEWDKSSGSVLGIPAGQTISGFSFKSKGLPTIVNAAFVGKRRAEYTFPSPDFDTQEVQQSFGRVLKSLKAQYPTKFADNVQGKTVGPIDPPATFNAAGFIQNLIALVNQSSVQGWIDNKGNTNSLLAKLNAALAKANANDNATAKNNLNAFMNEVSAQNGKHLTAEAYALLYFNAQYAVNHL